MLVEIRRRAPHSLEVQAQAFGRGLRGCAEIEESVIQQVLRIFRPVDADAVDLGILLAEVGDERLRVPADVKGREAAGIAHAALRHAAIGESRLVLFGGTARGDDVIGRDDGLDLEVGLEPGGARGNEEVAHDPALAARAVVGSAGLIAQPMVELQVGDETRRGRGVKLPPAPQRPVEQTHATGARVDGRLALPVLPVRRLHHVRRGGDGGGAGPRFHVAQNLLNPLHLVVFGHHGNADEALARGGRNRRRCGQCLQQGSAGQHLCSSING